MATGIDKSKVDAIQGYYFAHKDSLYTRTFVKPSYDSMMIVENKDVTLLPDANESKPVLQGWQAGHHNKGETVLGGRTLKKKKVKVDRTFVPGEFSVSHYKAYLVQSGNNPKDFPYEAYVLQMILSKMYEDYAQDVMWNGVEKPTIPGAPNNPQDTSDGFKKHIRDMIAAGDVKPLLTGPISQANSVDTIRWFVKKNLNTTARRNRRFVVYCSLDTLDAYQEGYENAHGADTRADDAYNLTRIHGTNSVLVAQDGLTGSELVLSRPANFHVGFDGAPHLELYYEHRYLYVEIDWSMDQQIQSPMELYVNGQF